MTHQNCTPILPNFWMLPTKCVCFGIWKVSIFLYQWIRISTSCVITRFVCSNHPTKRKERKVKIKKNQFNWSRYLLETICVMTYRASFTRIVTSCGVVVLLFDWTGVFDTTVEPYTLIPRDSSSSSSSNASGGKWMEIEKYIFRTLCVRP